jgi:hypothetical protein
MIEHIVEEELKEGNSVLESLNKAKLSVEKIKIKEKK